MIPRSTLPVAGLLSRMVACAAVSAALAGIGTIDAAAHTAISSTQHSLTATSGGFAGQLTSALAECTSGRAITLYPADAAVAVAVVSAMSDTHGAWSRSADTLSAGAYYAVAARVVKISAGHRHTCEAARSNTVTLAPDSDGDAVRDPSDNCPRVANAGQQDGDRDGVGDACDPDADGDGYTVTGGDCADDDAGRHPGAADSTRNGIDDDCDGAIDEDYASAVICDAGSSAVFNPETGTWSCVPLTTYECPIEPDARDAASAEWSAYLAADPELSDPVLISARTYPLDFYVACFGF
jgi:hypothetical protein